MRCSAGYRAFLDLNKLDKYLIPFEYAPMLSPEMMQRLSVYIRTCADPVAGAQIAVASAAGASKDDHNK